MNFFAGFFKAITNSFKGFSLIFEKGLWPYLFYFVGLWLLMLIGNFFLFSELSSQLSDYLNQQLNIEEIPESGAILSFAKPFLTGYFSFIMTWVFKIIFWFISITFTKYLILIALSPLFALLSESVEEKTIGIYHPFSIVQLIKDIGRGIIISLRNMLFEYFIIAIGFIITLIFPPLVFITGPFLMLASWYFIGFTMLDYNFERYKMSITESVSFTRKNIGLACGIGLVYTAFMWLPFFIGLMFGPALAVTGATLSFLELKPKKTVI